MRRSLPRPEPKPSGEAKCEYCGRAFDLGKVPTDLLQLHRKKAGWWGFCSYKCRERHQHDGGH